MVSWTLGGMSGLCLDYRWSIGEMWIVADISQVCIGGWNADREVFRSLEFSLHSSI